MSKIIALTQRVDFITDYNEKRDAIDQRISKLLFNCDYIPLLLPNDLAIATVLFNIYKPSGILLSGGGDLANYGGASPERDELENWLIKQSIDNNLPLLGICRGMQAIGNHFGEKLEQLKNHVATTHTINASREVNSFHNFGFVELKTQNFIATHLANDGSIEAFKHNSYNIYGIMWHPEREAIVTSEDLNLIREIFD
ncbi:gamma-glutamyl-gamma-aminobutyrate hydrolase family protein [Rickettsiales endosymbiont of Stachyamoeba lipophora]|uniref:gamma-glutamyl-gamma-aminobutyrate hydrolase family protein n=1 Tax=Rickettsiales endosymbiont of Stachyamoeba lipophora TaxID=2486578 RepID=UPI000F64D3CB|nr:gamma-glutamyl-gamma-aminobutyrate hydrolase family protein [Rickettsiales endosymbiont of Stachyamoeba lipophora]AZL16263.1 hypothetical protein EF513_06955 [Rickettsiales endosymbiont of Stachyamoeba lipophora]